VQRFIQIRVPIVLGKYQNEENQFSFRRSKETMKRILLVLVIAAGLLLPGCSVLKELNPQVITGSGVTARETRTVRSFDAIVLVGAAQVDVTLGDAETVEVEAEDNLLPYIETKVTAGKLLIRSRAGADLVTTRDIRITITTKTLESVELPGSGGITITGMEGKSLSLKLTGSGNITAEGSVQRLTVSLAGSGDILCAGLQAEDVEVSLYGSGNITLFASQTLDASIPGSGSITYHGSPSEVSKNIGSSGNLIAKP
jgi:hypothetical protein